jgi:GDPmannose 4,6-dehydratase
MQRRCLITGVTGQDGHYLASLLLGEGATVYGLVRRVSRDTEHVGVPHGVRIIPGDVTDPSTVRLIGLSDMDEIYHLAAMSHVGDSFEQPVTAMTVNAVGTANMLEAARMCGARFYQASTSELFGNQPPPQTEDTPFQPRSPYACAKAAAFHLVAMYRDAYGMHASNGILFNHESPLRGDDFVTQRVCRAAAAIAAGDQDKLVLGNLDARRDWGHAEDFVRGMVAMVRHDEPGDYVLATGESRSVRDLLDVAFGVVGVRDWRPHVVSDPALYRPLDVQDLCGDASRAVLELGWRRRWTFKAMIEEMVHAAALPARRVNVG